MGIMQDMSNKKGIKLEIKNRRIFGNFPDMWKLTNKLLNSCSKNKSSGKLENTL
jgi:hypothetical protein